MEPHLGRPVRLRVCCPPSQAESQPFPGAYPTVVGDCLSPSSFTHQPGSSPTARPPDQGSLRQRVITFLVIKRTRGPADPTDLGDP